MKYILFLFLFCGSSLHLWSQSKNISDIKAILEKQEAAWNRGDMQSFMGAGYWNNDSLMFIGKTGVTYGYQNTLDNYKKSYPDTAKMGKLSFNLLEFKPLSEGYYFVVGKWMLKRTEGDLDGHFTLVFKKIKERWLIVSDHSS